MKPFTLYRIILLLFVFGANNLYAVKTATIDQSKTESVATISATKTINNNTIKSKRKSRLIERVKEKFDYLFSKDSAQVNASQNEAIETKTHGLSVASLVLGILGILTAALGIGLLFAALAVIFGAVSGAKIKKSGGFYTGRGMAKAGLILGIIPLAALLLILGIIAAVGGF